MTGDSGGPYRRVVMRSMGCASDPRSDRPRHPRAVAESTADLLGRGRRSCLQRSVSSLVRRSLRAVPSWAGLGSCCVSHVPFDVSCRIAHGITAALNILTCTLHGIAAEQSADRDYQGQCHKFLHHRLLLSLSHRLARHYGRSITATSVPDRLGPGLRMRPDAARWRGAESANSPGVA